MSDSSSPAIKIIYGKKPASHEKEFQEMMTYESGRADEEAKAHKGPYEEPWLNVIHNCEPASMPGFERIKNTPELRRHIKGKVLDIGGGTCWLTAKLSLLPEVEQVYTVDLSEQFLKTTGTRIIKTLGGDTSKINFIISDFNQIPLPDESVDCAILFASIHHSLSPIKTLHEVGRCLKKGGSILIFENPPAAIKMREARRKALSLSQNISEICHSKEEWEYMMQASQVGPVECYPLDILSRGGLKMVIRKFLRRLNLEHILINPPSYLFIIRKTV